MPARLDITAWKRTPFNDEIVFIGPDWTGQDLRLEVRNQPGDTGEPLIRLDRVTTTGEGLSTTLDPAYPVPRTTVTAPATVLRVRVNKATLEALYTSSRTSDDLTLHYDLHVGNGTAQRVEMHGLFIIKPGVTL